MKKFTKIMLIVSSICIVLGTALMIGTAISSDVFDGNMVFLEQNAEYQNIRIAGNEIQELDISVKAASLEIVRDETIDGITIVDGSEFLVVNHSVEEDTLHLEIKKKDKYKIAGNIGAAKLTLMIPEHMSFQELEIDVSAGSLDADRLSAEEMGLNLNASSAVFTDVEAGDLDVDNNAGALEVSGTVTRKLEVDCNAGDVEMHLNGAYSDFNYKVDCKVGAVRVDDREYSGLKSAVSLKNENAKKDMSLDCNAGDIDVQFYE